MIESLAEQDEGCQRVITDRGSARSSRVPWWRQSANGAGFTQGRDFGAWLGLDGLVFTAGIGEHASEIRSRICARCSWLGVVLDESANRNGQMRITTEASDIRVYVIPTDEEKMIAAHTIK